MGKRQRAIISIIAVRQSEAGREVLLQRRSKEGDDTPYGGFLELPQGKIEARESVLDAAVRELHEETGLDLTCIDIGAEYRFATSENSSELFVSQPMILVADRMQNHLGIAIAASVRGETAKSAEARDHVWVPTEKLAAMLSEERIFPLNRPMLERFLQLVESANDDASGLGGVPQ